MVSFAGSHSRNQSHSCRAVTQMVNLKEHHMPSTPSTSTSHIYEASPVESTGSHRQFSVAEGGVHCRTMEGSPSAIQPQSSLAVNAGTLSQHADLFRLSDNDINNDDFIDKTSISC